MDQHESFKGWVILEEWRTVVDYEGIYEVSNHGQVRRVGKAARHGKGRGGGARVGHVRKPQEIRGGYLSVQLWRDGRQAGHLIHRLVATAFLGPIPADQEVNHRDGNKRNNAVGNLEYLTHADNSKHAYRTGLRTVTVEQMARARRKPRRIVACACGCGTQVETPDRKGRERSFVSGHNMRRAA